MRPEDYSVDSVVRLLHRQSMATLDELKAALGTEADITVFRKLRTLDYLSSYSHNGRNYALRAQMRFDARGLWHCRGVHFSRWGTLMETVAAWVERAEGGWFASELAAELAVAVKEPLLKLVREGRLRAGRFRECTSIVRRIPRDGASSFGREGFPQPGARRFPRPRPGGRFRRGRCRGRVFHEPAG